MELVASQEEAALILVMIAGGSAVFRDCLIALSYVVFIIVSQL